MANADGIFGHHHLPFLARTDVEWAWVLLGGQVGRCVGGFCLTAVVTICPVADGVDEQAGEGEESAPEREPESAWGYEDMTDQQLQDALTHLKAEDASMRASDEFKAHVQDPTHWSFMDLLAEVDRRIQRVEYVIAYRKENPPPPQMTMTVRDDEKFVPAGYDADLTTTEQRSVRPSDDVAGGDEFPYMPESPPPVAPPDGPPQTPAAAAGSARHWISIGVVLLVVGALVGVLVALLGGGSSTPSHVGSEPKNNIVVTCQAGGKCTSGSAAASTPEQVIGELSSNGSNSLLLSVKVLEASSWPQAVVFDLTGPGVPSSLTAEVPESGLMQNVPAPVDQGCPSPKVTWTAHIVSVGGKPANAQESSALFAASVGPCTKG